MSRHIITVAEEGGSPVVKMQSAEEFAEPYDIKVPEDVDVFTLMDVEVSKVKEVKESIKLIKIDARNAIYIPDNLDGVLYIIGKLKETCGTVYVYNPKTGKLFPLNIFTGRKYQVLDI